MFEEAMGYLSLSLSLSLIMFPGDRLAKGLLSQGASCQHPVPAADGGRDRSERGPLSSRGFPWQRESHLQRHNVP